MSSNDDPIDDDGEAAAEDGPAYEVGYGRPPQATRFQKGQSGNPTGRRQGSKNLATLARKALNETVVVNMAGRKRKMTKLVAALTQQANKAAAGDAKATRLMIDIQTEAEARDAGKPGGQDPAAGVQRHAVIMAALTARLKASGNGDGPGD